MGCVAFRDRLYYIRASRDHKGVSGNTDAPRLGRSSAAQTPRKVVRAPEIFFKLL